MSGKESLPIEGTFLSWVDALPNALPGAVRLGSFVQVTPGDALFDLPGVGRFRVREGRSIEVEQAAGTTREQAVFFASITPLGALVHQRGELPLHASTVMNPANGKAVLIAGASGAGKSTAAAAFAQRGWIVLSDDLSRLTFTDGVPLVWPGLNSLKLWHRSCSLLQLDCGALERTHEGKERFFWPQAPARGPKPVSAIVELQFDDREDSCRVTPIRGAHIVHMLALNTFRARLVGPLGRQKSHCAHVRNIAARTPCFVAKNSQAVAPHRLAELLDTVL